MIHFFLIVGRVQILLSVIVKLVRECETETFSQQFDAHGSIFSFFSSCFFRSIFFWTFFSFLFFFFFFDVHHVVVSIYRRSRFIILSCIHSFHRLLIDVSLRSKCRRSKMKMKRRKKNDKKNDEKNENAKNDELKTISKSLCALKKKLKKNNI